MLNLWLETLCGFSECTTWNMIRKCLKSVSYKGSSKGSMLVVSVVHRNAASSLVPGIRRRVGSCTMF